MRSTNPICVMIRLQYGISALAPQTSFRGESSGGVMKSWLLSRATIQEASCFFECYIKMSYLDILLCAGQAF